MPSAPPVSRRPQRERKANPRYEEGVDPEDETSLLDGTAPLVGQKRKAVGFGITAVFGEPLHIPRRQRTSAYAFDKAQDDRHGGHITVSPQHLRKSRKITAAASATTAGMEDEAAAELLLGMTDLITARSESPPSDSKRRHHSSGKLATMAEEKPLLAAHAALTAPQGHSRPGSAGSDFETITPAQMPPLPSAPASATTPPGASPQEAAELLRSRLAGPVAPTEGFQESLAVTHPSQRGMRTIRMLAPGAGVRALSMDGAQEPQDRPFWEPPPPLRAASATNPVGEGQQQATGQSGQRGPVRLLRITVPPVEGRCKCGRRISAAHPACKSELMMLCDRFIKKFGHLGPNGQPAEIMLNDVATQLGVPRRRLYDIINVMEAVEVVARTSKLTYIWRGMAHLPELLTRLMKEEDQEIRARKTATPARPGSAGSGKGGSEEDGKTSHSLWLYTRKFVRLLLTRPGPISLAEAAHQLLGDVPDVKRAQTQVTVERRLYDIGSILSSASLIKKSYLGRKRQPAFSWVWDTTPGHQIAIPGHANGEDREGRFSPQTPAPLPPVAPAPINPATAAAVAALTGQPLPQLVNSGYSQQALPPPSLGQLQQQQPAAFAGHHVLMPRIITSNGITITPFAPASAQQQMATSYFQPQQPQQVAVSPAILQLLSNPATLQALSAFQPATLGQQQQQQVSAAPTLQQVLQGSHTFQQASAATQPTAVSIGMLPLQQSGMQQPTQQQQAAAAALPLQGLTPATVQQLASLLAVQAASPAASASTLSGSAPASTPYIPITALSAPYAAVSTFGTSHATASVPAAVPASSATSAASAVAEAPASDAAGASLDTIPAPAAIAPLPVQAVATPLAGTSQMRAGPNSFAALPLLAAAAAANSGSGAAQRQAITGTVPIASVAAGARIVALPASLSPPRLIPLVSAASSAGTASLAMPASVAQSRANAGSIASQASAQHVLPAASVAAAAAAAAVAAAQHQFSAQSSGQQQPSGASLAPQANCAAQGGSQQLPRVDGTASSNCGAAATAVAAAPCDNNGAQAHRMQPDGAGDNVLSSLKQLQTQRQVVSGCRESHAEAKNFNGNLSASPSCVAASARS